MEEADRIKMESEQEKADIQVCWYIDGAIEITNNTSDSIDDKFRERESWSSWGAKLSPRCIA